MTNVINFKKAKSERLARDIQRLTREHEANQEAQRWLALSFGFEFVHAGEDRWGAPVYGVVHDGRVIIDGGAEFSLDEALALFRELMDHDIPPDQYRQHAEGFAALVADMHAEADAEIEATHE